MVTRDIVQRLLNVINDTRRRVNTLESREYVLLNATQTLTNKTLTTPSINNFTNAQHSHANAAGGGQLSLTTAVSGVLPAANGGTGVNNATRTLTINTNSGTLAFSGAGFTLTIPKTGTVPVGTGTAGRIAEWVTDANTVQASTLAKTGAGVLTLAAAANYTLTVPETGTAVLVAATQTLTNKTLTTPTIGDFSSAQHSHANAAGGGQLSLTTAVSGVLPAANGGTGVNNATRTLTINTNSGTLAFSGAGFTLTIPKTGTVPVGTGTAGRIAEWVTDANTVQASTLAKTGAGVLTLAAAANYTLTVPETGTAALLGTEQTFTQRQTIQTTDDLPLSVRSTSSFTDLRLGNGTLNLIDFRSWDGTVLYGRLQLTVATNIFSIQTRRVNGIIDLMTGNSTGTLTQAVRVTGTQSVLINTTTDNAQLSVNQSSATGAKPTLRLRQADLSEEFIRFDTTVDAGNPINTTALGAYYGRVRVWVEGVGAKWLALYD